MTVFQLSGAGRTSCQRYPGHRTGDNGRNLDLDLWYGQGPPDDVSG
jgi:hypothetical protein